MSARSYSNSSQLNQLELPRKLAKACTLALLTSSVAVVGMPNNVATSSSGALTCTFQKAEVSFTYISTLSVSNLE